MLPNLASLLVSVLEGPQREGKPHLIAGLGEMAGEDRLVVARLLLAVDGGVEIAAGLLGGALIHGASCRC